MDSVFGMLFAMVDKNYQRLVSIMEGVSQDELEYKELEIVSLNC